VCSGKKGKRHLGRREKKRVRGGKPRKPKEKRAERNVKLIDESLVERGGKGGGGSCGDRPNQGEGRRTPRA